MSRVVELLRRLTGAKMPPGAADLRHAEEEARAALDAAAAAVAALEAEHRTALLDAPDKEVERIEAQLATQRREVARAQAALEELGSRASAAEAREEVARLDELIRDADAAAEQAAMQLRTRYEPAAREVAALCDQAEHADTLVRAARAAALAAGRSFAVRDVSERLTVEGRIFVSFADTVSLRPVCGFPGWGSARELFERAGFSAELAKR